MEKSEAGEASPGAPPPSDVGRDPEVVGGGGGEGEPPVLRKGPAEAAGGPKKGKSCKGYLYYSSLLKSQSRKPICVGITRTLQQVPGYMVGESELEASKEGRNLSDFKYSCVGYSVFTDNKDDPSENGEKHAELPFCVGIELLVDRRVSTPGRVPAHAQNREAAGAGLSGSKMARRIGSVEEFDFKAIGENHNQGRLSVAILVSGFIFEKADFVKPWKGGPDGSERYAIQWETKNLVAVSNAIQDWLTSRLTMELMKQGAMMTVLSTLVAALAWPTALLSATDFIDGNWAIAINRSDKAGELLADVLLKGLQGNRPVTLVGFSLGARLIFKCLQYLAETGNNEGIIERVVLLGAPISLKDEPWESARRMVAGRFVNVYSTNDWILGVTFRASLLTKGLAGIQPVDVPGVENVDVTELIDGHSSYLWTAHQILDQLELDTYYPVFSCSAKSL